MSVSKEELERASKLALKGLKLPSGDRLQSIRKTFNAQDNSRPLEFESNPIVRVYPPTGKRYPMRVVRRSVAKPSVAPEAQEEIKQEVRRNRGRPKKP